MQALTLLAASVAHEIGNPLNALHIHLQLMEREIRKLRTLAGGGRPSAGPGGARGKTRTPTPAQGSEIGDAAVKLEQFLDVAKVKSTVWIIS